MLALEGNIVNKNNTFRGRIEIDERGMISKIGSPTGVADFIFWDELIFPGFIDLHVHAREDRSHRQDYKEDFITAGEAAINGGIVAMAEMPNNPTPPIDNGSYEKKKELTKKCPVEIVLYAGIGPHTKPLSAKVPYKVFMGPSVGDLFFHSKKELEKTIKLYKGQNVSFHCEDPEILKANKNQPTHELQRPAEAEVSAVDFALGLIEKYKLIGKICHCSTLASLEKVIAAKKRGLKVSVEITPHHLYFDQSMINEANKKWLQINPPLRNSTQDRLKIIELLKKGEIDYLATDHAPHTIAEKEKGISGMPHLDTYGPFVTWLMKKHNFTPQEITKICSQNPGNFINNFTPNKYGEIKEGYIGSLTVLDMSKPATITRNMLKTKCGWSPFEGVIFPGSVAATLVKGKIYVNEK